MNKNGSAVFVYFMFAVLFFLLGMALAPALTDTTTEVRADLNCTNTTITDANRAICTQVDSFPPLYIGVLFGLGGIIFGRLFV